MEVQHTHSVMHAVRDLKHTCVFGKLVSFLHQPSFTLIPQASVYLRKKSHLVQMPLPTMTKDFISYV